MMNSKLTITCLLIFMFVTTGKVMSSSDITLTEFPGLQQQMFVYRDTVKNVDGRFPGFSPWFMIYPDKPCNKEQAEALIRELGIDKYLSEYSATVSVVNPIGNSYDNAKDFDAYKELLNKLRVFTNLKIIGIGSGATFVNNTIANHAGAVAGIVSINGKSFGLKSVGASVPAFIAGANSKHVASSYIKRNEAVMQSKSGELAFYANEQEPLLQVVVSTDKQKSLKETFDDAWTHLLSKNYRFNNYKHTWYTGTSFDQYGPYQLEPYIMPDEWNVSRLAVEKDLLGTGTFLWYEFHPQAIQNAPKASVPLLLLLHGNNNDPRTQAETSGFIEVCAKENFMVAELEWQGNGYAPMGLDGIELVVYHLLETYPQLDPSRVYAEGLSAGSATATALGIRKSHLFAAVGGHSAGLIPNRYAFGYSLEALLNEATQKRSYVEMPYFSITGTDDETVPFPNQENWQENTFFHAWKTYQTMNGMAVTDQLDFNKYDLFGLELKDRQTLHTNKNISMETGSLYKGNVPLIKLVAVMDYGHWNFKPAAQLMWDYFKLFARNPETKELIYKP
ncbi:poly(3-hydroxybutyrate) depolymerase [Parabacteroides sp. PF5-5]|uniref:PHB depolymerase family esterase n=3 Tax=Parabacteroides TaxID=375288 RepID=UPI002476DDD9|nr:MULTISPECIES: PHB depolymerase family esterase [unclassified Parabacteroides]MDH6303649.1 poly(3-hydroxybutyrate) depolymerase [Parabacteroides sp. PH5-39]MDH6314971.1 poly(3-hydroxybutyrate) depolymerase [Parabacteroides sp. PF5-13]MDH6325883.1 poly(3-hydroxybutyrate) depolymerase [Parabacteroides sp. PH5-41]MDH6333683.1 poly(3-hydroxybutyrate) depolymerase [Parabacteroides sp. PF5-5]MDH6344748.1 poly(3-hydroxybutyrate) depolymerase [Parabacteroides sp. PH5-46]